MTIKYYTVDSVFSEVVISSQRGSEAKCQYTKFRPGQTWFDSEPYWVSSKHHRESNQLQWRLNDFLSPQTK